METSSTRITLPSNVTFTTSPPTTASPSIPTTSTTIPPTTTPIPTTSSKIPTTSTSTPSTTSSSVTTTTNNTTTSNYTTKAIINNNVDPGGLGTGAIAGIIAGCIAFVVILVLILAIILYRRKRHKRRSNKPVRVPPSRRTLDGIHERSSDSGDKESHTSANSAMYLHSPEPYNDQQIPSAKTDPESPDVSNQFYENTSSFIANPTNDNPKKSPNIRTTHPKRQESLPNHAAPPPPLKADEDVYMDPDDPTKPKSINLPTDKHGYLLIEQGPDSAGNYDPTSSDHDRQLYENVEQKTQVKNKHGPTKEPSVRASEAKYANVSPSNTDQLYENTNISFTSTNRR